MIALVLKLENKTMPKGASANLDALILRAQQGDPEAFETLARFFWAPIYRMVYYRVRSKMDAEDITQEVFVSAYKRMKGLKDPSKFPSWLFTIALNRVRDHGRKKRFLSLVGISSSNRENEVEEFAGNPGHDPLGATIRRDFWGYVETFLGKLSKAEKDVFILRFVDQLSINEIAEVMGKGQSTIKTHLYRAVAKFRKDTRFQVFLEGLG